MGKRVAYKIVSSLEQETDQLFDGMTFDRVFEDKMTKNSSGRPELIKMLHYIGSSDNDHLYIHEMSHLSNSMIDLYQIIDVIRKKGASITFMKEQITFEPDHNPREVKRALFGMKSVFTTFERSLIKHQQNNSVLAVHNKKIDPP